jgi:hypothetical protein
MGADINAHDRWNNTPINDVEKHGHLELKPLLEKYIKHT